MSAYQPHLAWIDARHDAMVATVERWSAVNSGSHNLGGLAAMLELLEAAFAGLGGDAERLDLAPLQLVGSDGAVAAVPVGQALRIRKRPDAPVRVLLSGHMDTVYGADHPFQASRYLDDRRLNGPGVADMKGGILVMLTALQALERSPFRDGVGWEVLLSSDEEIGSLSSNALLQESARRADLGLIYEPTLPDGTLVSERKGTGNFHVVVHGRAAHAGRDHASGRNAIVALADFVTELDRLNGARDGFTVNVGIVEGGRAINIVPDLGIARFDVRIAQPEDAAWLEGEIDRLKAAVAARDGIHCEVYGRVGRMPKRMDAGLERLFDMVGSCGEALGIEIRSRPTGGCCDGNNLAAAGLANIDTMGVRGDKIHSSDEYVILESLTERAKLSALLLMRLGAGDLQWPRRPEPGRE